MPNPRGRIHTTVELSGRKNNHEDIGARVLLCNVVAHEAGHGADDEDREQLKAYDALEFVSHLSKCCVVDIAS